MEPSPFGPKSPMIDTPVCDSDEEVFFGPVTSKELQKASQLKRRTQFYFPSFDWKPSDLPSENISVQSGGITETGLEVVGSGSVEQPKLSLSVDSLESQSFVTSSERPEDSSKGDYWSALSGNSSGSQASLNEGHLYSKFSVDSLDSDQAPSTVKKCPPKYERPVSNSKSPRTALSFHSNISDDSLEDGSTKQFNVGKLVSGFSDGLSSSELKSSDSSLMKDVLLLHDEANLQNETYVKEKTNFSNESKQFNSTEVLSDSLENITENVAPANASIPGVEESISYVGNNTYSLEDESNECQGAIVSVVNSSNNCQVIELENSDIDVPEVIADKDGGFLSILSEAALYHASQIKETGSTAYHEHEESTSTTQSLEDRFKVFGIDAGDLEDQQLSNSIMYTTGRESNGRYSEIDNNTFYTGRNNTVGFSTRNFDVATSETSQTTLSSFNDLSSVSSLGLEQLSSCDGKREQINLSSGSQVSAKSESNVLNQQIQTSGLSSQSCSSSQDSKNLSHQEQVNINNLIGTESLNDSSKYPRESLQISGVYPLSTHLSESDLHNEFLKEREHYDLEPSSSADEGEAVLDNSGAASSISEGIRELSHNDSGASSNFGELNDTIEEYEMMMKYGVDYILGRKGNKKETSKGIEENHLPDSGDKLPQSPIHVKASKNSSGSSMEYLDAVEFTSKQNQFSRVKEPKPLSPLQKQVLKSTPQKSKDMRCVPSKQNTLKLSSKLPRVASAASVRPLLTPSPQKTKNLMRPLTYSEPKTSSRPQSRPVTPSSETKIGAFKKPIAPALPVSRLPKTTGIHQTAKSSNKILEKIQSPVGAYIHNSPSPVLVTNVKAKTLDRAPYERENHAKALWRAGEMKSSIPRPGSGSSQAANTENVNPNVGCGLPAVKYTKAPCIKLDEPSKFSTPRVGEKINKLLDAPSPQVIKHEGRLRVNCGSPQLAAKMQSMAESFDDSLMDVHSVSGDISVCVSQTACRTNTLGH